MTLTEEERYRWPHFAALYDAARKRTTPFHGRGQRGLNLPQVGWKERAGIKRTRGVNGNRGK